MASLAEFARVHTRLGTPQIDHLQRLVASWGLLADLCFADLLLFVATDEPQPGVGREHGPERDDLVVLGQVRPLTNQTLYRSDWVGTVVPAEERPLVARSLELGEIIEGEVTNQILKERVRALCIPVRWMGQTIAVVNREAAPSVRHPGELERTYIEVFNRFARMIASGEFPFRSEEGLSEEAPRVGDGVILLDGSGRVEYSSPNAISALHRIGVHANTEGMRLGEIGLQETAVRTAFATALPATEEIERGPQVTVLMRCIPLLEHGTVTGAVVLLRDISELRRRDRLLLSKDATIREIHHRVKNNLQTISSLLRLQGRRLASPRGQGRGGGVGPAHPLDRPCARDPVARGGRRRALHRDRPPARAHGRGGPAVARPPGRHQDHRRRGQAAGHHRHAAGGRAQRAAAERRRPRLPDEVDGEGGHVLLELDNDGAELRVRVTDDGAGLPEGFSLDAATGLGLSIVRTLVTTELDGTIELVPGPGGATGRAPRSTCGCRWPRRSR